MASCTSHSLLRCAPYFLFLQLHVRHSTRGLRRRIAVSCQLAYPFQWERIFLSRCWLPLSHFSLAA